MDEPGRHDGRRGVRAGRRAVPRDHRQALADALERRAARGWPAWPDIGVHRVKVVAGTGRSALLSQRARLALRVRRERVGALAPLAGRRLRYRRLRRRASARARRASCCRMRTLYAYLVASRRRR